MHLQCHIGTDTISLARLGASMTGLDFSGPAVAEMVSADGGEWRLAEMPGRLAASFTIQAARNF